MAFERMEAETWNVHVGDNLCRIQCRQLNPEPPGVVRCDPSHVPELEKTSQSLVPKGLDHGAIVWRCASRNNHALPKALFPILEWNVIMTSTYRGNAALGTRHFRTN